LQFCRERRNEDQPIQAPIKNENLIDSFEEDQIDDIDEEINMMEGDLSEVYVTQDDYEKYVSFNSYFNEDDNNNNHLIHHHLNIEPSQMHYKLNYIENMTLDQEPM
jgi:hypothetical protein